MRIIRVALVVLGILGSLANAAVAWGQSPPGDGSFRRWAPEPGITQSLIGSSALGRPLVVHHLGEGDPVLLVGAQHGGPERNTSTLVWQLMGYFEEHPDAIPANLRLDIMP